MKFQPLNTRAHGADHFAGVSKMVGGVSQSQRDLVHQPRVARNELPWGNGKENFQPRRGCVLLAPMGRKPYRIEEVGFTRSQGSSFLATLRYNMESHWNSPPEMRTARNLNQPTAGNVADILEVFP